jgi:hypothetical protein
MKLGKLAIENFFAGISYFNGVWRYGMNHDLLPQLNVRRFRVQTRCFHGKSTKKEGFFRKLNAEKRCVINHSLLPGANVRKDMRFKKIGEFNIKMYIPFTLILSHENIPEDNL